MQREQSSCTASQLKNGVARFAGEIEDHFDIVVVMPVVIVIEAGEGVEPRTIGNSIYFRDDVFVWVHDFDNTVPVWILQIRPNELKYSL